MKLDQTARYVESDEWVRKDGDVFVIGVTDFAQDQLSDVVFVEFPEVDSHFEENDEWGVIESVKAANGLFMPLTGTIIEINQTVVDTPELVNDDPYGEGWLIKVKADNPSDWDNLMTPEAYASSRS